MVAVKFLALIFTFYFFVVVDVFGQNFYPTRYGKREENDSQVPKNLLEGKRLGRSEDRDALADKKMRFFLSGGRFGKRVCSSKNCFQGSKEIFNEEPQARQSRNERIRNPIRKNQFMMGSRFGKRTEENGNDPKGGENLNCIYTGISDFYRCSNKEGLRDDSDLINANFVSEFFQ